jgi:N-acetylglutamate synthase-like GNAT family acetyltransferase
MKFIQNYKLFNENIHSGVELSIREATKSELKSFVDLVEEEGPNNEDYNILDLISRSNNIIGAFENDIMIGAMEFKEKNNFTEITLILTLPSRRNEEIGKYLIQYVIDNSTKEYIITHPYTYEAEKFFKKNGFKYDENFDKDDTNTMIKNKK